MLYLLSITAQQRGSAFSPIFSEEQAGPRRARATCPGKWIQGPGPARPGPRGGIRFPLAGISITPALAASPASLGTTPGWHLQAPPTQPSPHRVILAPRPTLPGSQASRCVVPRHPPGAAAVGRLLSFPAMLCPVGRPVQASFLPSLLPSILPGALLPAVGPTAFAPAPRGLAPTQPVCLSLTSLSKRGPRWGKSPQTSLAVYKYSRSQDFPTACDRFYMEVWGHPAGHTAGGTPSSFLCLLLRKTPRVSIVYRIRGKVTFLKVFPWLGPTQLSSLLCLTSCSASKPWRLGFLLFVMQVPGFFSFFFSFIYSFMREGETGRDPSRGRSRLPAGSPIQDSIPGPRGHALSQGRCSTTEPPRCPQVPDSSFGCTGIHFKDDQPQDPTKGQATSPHRGSFVVEILVDFRDYLGHSCLLFSHFKLLLSCCKHTNKE